MWEWERLGVETRWWGEGGGREDDRVEPGPPFLGHPRSIWPHRSRRAPWPPCEYPICSSTKSPKPHCFLLCNCPVAAMATVGLTSMGPSFPPYVLTPAASPHPSSLRNVPVALCLPLLGNPAVLWTHDLATPFLHVLTFP